MTTLSDDPKLRFVEIVINTYNHFFAPLTSAPDAGGERRFLLEQVESCDLLGGVGDPVSLAADFQSYIQNLSNANRLVATQPFQMHVSQYVRNNKNKYKNPVRRQLTKSATERPGMDTPLNRLPEATQAARLQGMFEGLVTLVNAPRDEHQMTAVASRYVGILGHLTPREIDRRLGAIAARSRFFPTPAEILAMEPVAKATKALDEEAPLSDPSCGCEYGWMQVGSYQKPCWNCALGKWLKARNH